MPRSVRDKLIVSLHRGGSAPSEIARLLGEVVSDVLDVLRREQERQEARVVAREQRRRDHEQYRSSEITRLWRAGYRVEQIYVFLGGNRQKIRAVLEELESSRRDLTGESEPR
jgi:hypothetical protein